MRWLRLTVAFLDLTEAIDIYSEWIDAADAAERDAVSPSRRPTASSSRAAPAVNFGSDEE